MALRSGSLAEKLRRSTRGRDAKQTLGSARIHDLVGCAPVQVCADFGAEIRDDGRANVLAGVTTIEEVMRVTRED